MSLSLTFFALYFVQTEWKDTGTCPHSLIHTSPSVPVSVLTNCVPSRSTFRKEKTVVKTMLKNTSSSSVLLFSIILSGDIQLNPGPQTVYPCGYCEHPVTWDHQRAVCCDQCSIWYHSACIELSAKNIEALQHTSTSWLCGKCHTPNVDNLTYHSFELETTNQFSVLSHVSTIPSVDSAFSPIAHSSPKPRPLLSSSTEESQSSANVFRHKPRHNLRTLIVNCQSIRNKRTQFAEATHYFKPDIIIGSESWLSSDIKNSEIFPDNFKINVERKDRNKNGGGVFVAVRDNYETSTVEGGDANCEIAWTEIQTDSKNVIVGPYYRPPSATIDSLEQLNESLHSIKEKSKDKIVILAGDFNLPHIEWETLAVKAGCHQSNQHHRLLDIISEHGLEQMQPHATREGNNLDLYFTTHPSLVKACDTVPGVSDHCMVVIDSEIKPRYNSPKRRKIYQYKKANWETIGEKMLDTSQRDCECMDIEECWNLLKQGISVCLDSDVPSKLTSKRHNLPWLNRKLINKIRRKHKLYQKAKQTQHKEDWDKYKLHKSATQREVRKAHWDYVNKTLTESLESGNNKSFWKYIKSKRSDSIGIAGLKQNGVLHQDSKEKAEILNAQFKSVFTREDPNEQLPKIREQHYPTIGNLEITSEGVEKLLRN